MSPVVVEVRPPVTRPPTPARRLLAPPRRLQRRATATLRVLPDFLVIGAQKSGTTTLYDYLTQHRRIAPALRKEVHYLDQQFDRGPAWYRSHFPLRLTIGAALTGEATPYYLFHPLAPARATATVPEAKILAVLRNPVDRAFSHYQHERSKGHEHLGFAKALAAERRRTAGELERLRAGEITDSYPLRRFSYVARGRYAEQLERWLVNVPPGRLLVLAAEELFTEPRRVMRTVFTFLGLDDDPAIRVRQLNARRYEPMDPEIRTALTAQFAPHNRRLATLLGRDFDWDTPGGAP